MALDILQLDLQNQTGNRVEITGKGLTAQAQSFKRNGSTTCKGIHNEGCFFGMSSLDKAPRDLDIDWMRREAPVGEVPDEFEKCPLQVFIFPLPLSLDLCQ
jgi:hypothetical protein